MPKPARRVPTYRKHKPSGQAVVTLSGTDFYLGPHGSQTSIAEYDRLVAEWLAIGPPPAPPRRRIRLHRQRVARCLLGTLRTPLPKERRSRPAKSPASRWHSARFAGCTVTRKPADFGPLSLKACRQQMIDAGWERESINTHVGRIRRMFKWGAENELVPVRRFPSPGDRGRIAEGQKRSGRNRARQPRGRSPG